MLLRITENVVAYGYEVEEYETDLTLEEMRSRAADFIGVPVPEVNDQDIAEWIRNTLTESGSDLVVKNIEERSDLAIETFV